MIGAEPVWFPGLRDSMPLLFFGGGAVVTSLYLRFTNTSPIHSRVPFWEFVLLLGVIAIIGAMLGSRVANEEEAVADPIRPAPTTVPRGMPDPQPIWDESGADESDESFPEDPLEALASIELDLGVVSNRSPGRHAEPEEL